MGHRLFSITPINNNLNADSSYPNWINILLKIVKPVLKQYFVLHSTVTFLISPRLLDVNQIKLNIMRTLNSNRITEKVSATKGYAWNLKRRYR